MKKSLVLSIAISLIGLTSCTKKEVVNVVSSSTGSSSWVFDDPSWTLSLSYPAITQDIIDNGAVLVYLKNGQAYNQLPLTIYQSASYSTSIEVSTFVGGVKIFWTDSDLIEPVNPGYREIKVVVISANGLAKNPSLDLEDYEAVVKAYNLNENESFQFIE